MFRALSDGRTNLVYGRSGHVPDQREHPFPDSFYFYETARNARGDAPQKFTSSEVKRVINDAWTGT